MKIGKRLWAPTAFLFGILLQGSHSFADEAACPISTDAQGIPHVQAVDETGVFRCQGYLHGRDRAWQMDYFRRLSQGRLSEILGFKTVKVDFQMRLMGLSERVAKLYDGLSPESKALLTAYAEGANLGMKEALGPLGTGAYEFRAFGYQPEPWKPEDTIGIIILQSFDQTRRSFEEKLREQKRLERYGKNAPALFTEDGVPWDTAILKSGEYQPRTSAKAGDAPIKYAVKSHGEVFAELDPGFDVFPGIGSNNWALAGSRSKSGKALFANDPHLDLKTPSFWYWSNIRGGSLHVLGSSVPGIPMIVSGTNGNVAWGLTNAYMDVSDLFYRDEKSLSDASVSRPWIWFRFWKFKLPVFFKTFRRTAEGWPILPLASPRDKALVLRWSGFDLQSADFDSFFKLMGGRNVEEMDALLAATRIPSWNFVFADDRGQIGYRTIGRVPARNRALPYGVADKTGAWAYLDATQMPHVLKPKRGYVVTANNRQWPADAESWSGRNYRHGFRAQRIEELLLSQPKQDLEFMRKIQCDTRANDAPYFLPLLLKTMERTPNHGASAREDLALRLLKSWDFTTGVKCVACPIYRLWMERILADYGLDERGLYHFLSDPHPPEDFSGGVRAAFLMALDTLDVREGSPLRAWGKIHRASFPHFAGPGEFPTSAIAVPGDEHSVNVSSSDWLPEKGFLQARSGASQRWVVELSHPLKIFMILPGFERDSYPINIADPDGPWMKWSRCEYQEVDF